MFKSLIGTTSLVVSLCVLGSGLWAFWLEPSSLYNENYQIDLPNWPDKCDGLRVAVLADLHVGSPYNGVDKLGRVVNVTLAAKPDLILRAGDYVIHGVLGGGCVLAAQRLPSFSEHAERHPGKRKQTD